jgi:hypothetical protein
MVSVGCIAMMERSIIAISEIEQAVHICQTLYQGDNIDKSLGGGGGGGGRMSAGRMYLGPPEH